MSADSGSPEQPQDGGQQSGQQHGRQNGQQAGAPGHQQGQQPWGGQQWGQQPPPQGQYGQYGHQGWGQGGGGAWAFVPIAPKPGTVPLRPLAFGDIFGAVFDTLRRYAKAIYLPLLVVAGIAAVPVIALSVAAVSPLSDVFRHAADDDNWEGSQDAVVRLLWSLGGLALVWVLVIAVMYVVTSTVSTVVLRSAAIGRPMTAGQAWKEARPWLWRVLGSQALLYGSMLLAWVAVAVAGTAIAAAADVPQLFLVLVPVDMALLGVVVYVAVRLVPQVAVLVLEESTVTGSIRRAWRLNLGNWWRSLLIPLAVAAVGRAAVGFLTSPFSIAVNVMTPTREFSTDPASVPTPDLPGSGALAVLVVIGAVLGLLGVMATLPLTPLANGLLYMDRRIRNERLDLALAEAAGIRLTDPGQPTPPGGAPGTPGQPT
ncbi:hypothetical protein AB0K51_23060 [Kitasatospora sp. NPDC049285]|uniref:hypothetical protein n=1 Tax=Kitasatospora sp. NPDC049285 TaxID=3157096 RepID=UPI003434ED67